MVTTNLRRDKILNICLELMMKYRYLREREKSGTNFEYYSGQIEGVKEVIIAILEDKDVLV